MKLLKFVGASSATLLVSATLTQAASLVVINHSFEQNVLGDGGFQDQSQVITGWTRNPSTLGIGDNFEVGIQDPQNAQYAGTTGAPGTLPGTADGVQFAFTRGGTINFPRGSLTQTLPDVLTVNTLYTLTVAAGDRLDEATANPIIRLFAGATQIGSDATGVLVDGTFTDWTLTFTALAGNPLLGQNLQIFLSKDGTNPGVGSNLDNVRLDATLIPEPSTTALGAMAVLGLLGVRRRSA